MVSSSAAWLFLNRAACTGRARGHDQDDHGQCDQARRLSREAWRAPARAPANPGRDRRFASAPGPRTRTGGRAGYRDGVRQGIIPGCVIGLDKRAGHAVQVRMGRATAPTAQRRHQRSFRRSRRGRVMDALPSEVKARLRQKCAKLSFAGASLVSAMSSRDAVTVGSTILGRTTAGEKTQVR